MKKKNILIYIPKLYHGGGGERSSLALGSALSSEYNVRFLTQHHGDIVENPEPIQCLGQAENMFWKGVDFIPTAYRLKKICQKQNIDIVISNMARANTITMLSKILFRNKTKNILITRNANSGRMIHGLWMKLWGKAEKNVAVSYGAEHVLKTKGLEKTCTIYNAYNIPQIKEKLQAQIEPEHEALFDGGPVFLNIGRLHKQKGQEYLITSFAEVVTQHRDAKLLIAGGGHLKEDLKSLAVSLGLENNVHLLGNIKNVFPYLRRSDCFVLSSLWEGLPTVVIEALISNSYIIATDCLSGPREILSTKPYGEKLSYPYRAKHGTLITDPMLDPVKTTQELTQAISNFITNPKTQAPADITQYSYESVASAWVDLIESL